MDKVEEDNLCNSLNFEHHTAKLKSATKFLTVQAYKVNGNHGVAGGQKLSLLH